MNIINHDLSFTANTVNDRVSWIQHLNNTSFPKGVSLCHSPLILSHSPISWHTFYCHCKLSSADRFLDSVVCFAYSYPPTLLLFIPIWERIVSISPCPFSWSHSPWFPLVLFTKLQIAWFLFIFFKSLNSIPLCVHSIVSLVI